MNLDVSSQDYDMLQAGVGARIIYPAELQWCNLTLTGHAKLLYDFVGDKVVVISKFTGGGGSFTSEGADLIRCSLNAGGELVFDFRNHFSVIGDCNLETEDNFLGISSSLTARYEFE